MFLAALVAVLALLLWTGHWATGRHAPARLWLMRPIALALAENGKWLLIANRHSGTIASIDTGTLRVVAETRVGLKLADLALTPDGRQLVVVDEEANELIILRRQGAELEVTHRLPVSPAPVSVRVARDGSRCWVASLWSRCLTVVDLAQRRVLQSIPLGFAPRHQMAVRDDTRLIVADAFGGRLAVVNLDRGEVASVRTIPAHNIRGLALSADRKDLLVSHQILNRLAETTTTDIHWGNLITNHLRALPLSGVLTPSADVLHGSRLQLLGDIGRGAGDPAGIATDAEGNVIVALAGVNEIALSSQKRRGTWQRLQVGRRPTAVEVSPERHRAYVANTSGDSITVVDLRDRKIEAEIVLGARPQPVPANEGETLFYDARLSFEGWFSCHSCHTDGHSNGLLADTLGDGSFGTPKRVLSLRGVRDTEPWAWNGSMPDLESQIHKSITTTMRGARPSKDTVAALTAFLKTLAPPPSARRVGEKLDEAAVRRGRDLFDQQGCAVCHAPPAYTSRKTYDVGLHDEAGNKHFNPPSLRGIAQGGPFFHDGRAATLDEVFSRFQHQLQRELTEQERKDLIAFLRSL
jgi:DNA-binding beta-propeller fold protein YncE/mono/diheme cytochrome c family protein